MGRPKANGFRSKSDTLWLKLLITSLPTRSPIWASRREVGVVSLVAVAGDHPDAVQTAMSLVNDTGFDPVFSGTIAESWALAALHTLLLL